MILPDKFLDYRILRSSYWAWWIFAGSVWVNVFTSVTRNPEFLETIALKALEGVQQDRATFLRLIQWFNNLSKMSGKLNNLIISEYVIFVRLRIFQPSTPQIGQNLTNRIEHSRTLAVMKHIGRYFSIVMIYYLLKTCSHETHWEIFFNSHDILFTKNLQSWNTLGDIFQ